MQNRLDLGVGANAKFYVACRVCGAIAKGVYFSAHVRGGSVVFVFRHAREDCCFSGSRVVRTSLFGFWIPLRESLLFPGMINLAPFFPSIKPSQPLHLSSHDLPGLDTEFGKTLPT